MKLITKEIARALPPIYTHDGKPAAEVPVVFKLFNPCGAATWYVTEGNLETGELFGLADLGMGHPELGYFDLNELKAIDLPFGLKIERDLHYCGTLADAMKSCEMAVPSSQD